MHFNDFVDASFLGVNEGVTCGRTESTLEGFKHRRTPVNSYVSGWAILI